jgi:hypothetical protein
VLQLIRFDIACQLHATALAVHMCKARLYICASVSPFQVLSVQRHERNGAAALQEQPEAPVKLVDVLADCTALPRLGLTAAALTRPLRWQDVFDEGLVLTREHCEIMTSAHNGRESTTKALAKLFPDAVHKCAM